MDYITRDLLDQLTQQAPGSPKLTVCTPERLRNQLVASQPTRLVAWRILGEMLVCGQWGRLKKPGCGSSSNNNNTCALTSRKQRQAGRQLGSFLRLLYIQAVTGRCWHSGRVVTTPR